MTKATLTTTAGVDDFISFRLYPSRGWHVGELWSFNNYIIPLAKKLEECRGFGVSSDEYLNYALENKIEWEHKRKERNR
jgi:hypothetical protein